MIYLPIITNSGTHRAGQGRFDDFDNRQHQSNIFVIVKSHMILGQF